MHNDKRSHFVIHLGKYHRAQRYETKSDNYHGKTNYKSAKSQLLRSIQQILQSTKSDQLEAINTCICTPAGDDVHIPGIQRCETLIGISTAMKHRVCADFCSLHRMQQILQGSKLISYQSNICIVVVMINALTFSSTSENTIARSGMKQSRTITMVKTSLKS